MRRVLAFVLLLALLAGCATRPKPHVIAILLSDDVRLPKVNGLKAGLAAHGYSNEALQFRIYSAAGDRAALGRLATELLAARPAVAVAGGGVEAVALRDAVRAAGATTPTPVVLMGVASSVRTGLIDSFARPGGQITGLDNQHAELSGKRLELLIKLLPQVRRVLVLYDPTVTPGHHALAVTQAAAGQLGVTITPLAAETIEQVLQRIRGVGPGQYDAALLLPAFVLESGSQQVMAELDRLKLPVMGPLELDPGSGLLAAYGISMREQGQQSARFVVKLLQGGRPADIPVETPDNPRLVVNAEVARRLGLTLSPVGLALAGTPARGAGDGR